MTSACETCPKVLDAGRMNIELRRALPCYECPHGYTPGRFQALMGREPGSRIRSCRKGPALEPT